MLVVRGDEGEEVRGVEEQRVERELESLHHLGNQLLLNGFDELDGQLVHLVPEVLTGQPVQVGTGQLPQGRRLGPLGKAALAGCMASAPDGNERQGLANAEAVVLPGRFGFLALLLRGAKSATVCRQVAVDGTGDIQLVAERAKRGDGAMREAPDTQGLSRLKAGEDVSRPAEVRNGDRPRLSVHASRLNDSPVSPAMSADSLKARHSACIRP